MVLFLFKILTFLALILTFFEYQNTMTAKILAFPLNFVSEAGTSRLTPASLAPFIAL